MNWLKWLYPGIGVKRWILLALIGVIVLVVGMAGMLGAESTIEFGRLFKDQLSALSRFVTGTQSKIVAAVVTGLGMVMVVIALGSLVRAISSAYRPYTSHSGDGLVEALLQKNILSKGPKIVAIGGGTGLSTILEGLRELSSNITAIVTVADNGGSSGRLRALDLPAPGDIRNCILALANASDPMKTLFNYRFTDDVASQELRGHNFGNLLIATLTQITGDFTEAVKMACSILDVRGIVLPSTSTSNVTLCAECTDGTVVCGETEVGRTPKNIRRVFLQPEDCHVTEDALRAIKEADLIVLGPGSLYTSIIATMLVKGLADAVRESKARKVYICNAMTQVAETLGYTAYDHVKAIIEHTNKDVIDMVLVNTATIEPDVLKRYHEEGAGAVHFDKARLTSLGVQVIAEDFIEQHEVVRHDTKKVSWHLANLLWQKKGERWKIDFSN